MIANGLESHGVLRGRTIELDRELAVPDGTEVRVIITVVAPAATQDVPAALIETFGCLADEGAEIDEFNRWYREARKIDRPELDFGP